VIRVVQITAEAVVARAELLGRIARGGPWLAVLLRDPELDAGALYAWGRELRAATRAVGAALWVDDRIDVAVAVEADGVHLGRRSPPVAAARRLLKGTVTRSAHDLAAAERAAAEGADAVLLSPIFASPGKGAPLGEAALSAVRARLPAAVAVIALGGVTPANAGACFAAGADGLAAISADLGACAMKWDAGGRHAP
jgi:thiamine-phosphate pyrophosphorylase